MRISGSIVTLLLLNVDPSSSFTSPAYLPRTFGVKSTDALYFKKGDMTDLSTMEPLLREEEEYGSGMTKKKSLALVRRIWNRLDTMKSSGVLLRDDDDDDSYQVGSAVAPAATQTAADYVSKTSEYGLKPPKPIDPSVLKRSDGGWKGILMFFGTFAGLIFWRWYRSKYIVKTNFWDIQPGLNIVVTSKKQDDELRAYTCKNCKATIFIARNREWYFEGETGLAGLGCFTCGTKGADNFVMDRDRIKEEVGDEDDFWENDRPMDYVQKAEYKVLLKQCGGDKEAALKLMEDKEAKEEALEAATRPEAFAEKYVKDAEVVEDDDGEAGDDGDDGDDDEEYDDDDDDDV
uniref:Uncharacterized protein n=1 Tax=Grammatophora oceanica TaxID=210454 RepID=A0A6U5N471_9STRA|mmetsp:Transcript_42724/g.63368  ORF Transcript_42724/g.63368 Transcript_42724/m.63368 type:complete len:347 (+) Transcript_42724:118-1158(+)